MLEILFKDFFKYGRVIGFEPNIENYKKFHTTINIKELRYSILLFPIKCKVKFYLPDKE